MIWLYRLQQRLSLTRREGAAILTLTLLFLLGLTVRHVQEQQVRPLPVDSLVARSSDTLTTGAASPSPSAPSANAPLNLNEASGTALEKLPGIGPALSKRIQTYRSSQGDFQRIDELTNVSGIGPKTLADLRPLIRVSDGAEASD